MPNRAKRESGYVLRGARVLIVEDDILLLMELEMILQDAGAELAGCCRSVAEAVAVAARGGIEAAILDVRVGRETIAPVARELASHGTPFIFYTGQVEKDPELEEWHGCRILAKPARPAAIVAAIAELVGTPSRPQA